MAGVVLYQAFLFTVAATIISGFVFVVRWGIARLFYNKKQWSRGWYYFIYWAAAAAFCCKFGLVGFVFGVACMYIGWNKAKQGNYKK